MQQVLAKPLFLFFLSLSLDVTSAKRCFFGEQQNAVALSKAKLGLTETCAAGASHEGGNVRRLHMALESYLLTRVTLQDNHTAVVHVDELCSTSSTVGGDLRFCLLPPAVFSPQENQKTYPAKVQDRDGAHSSFLNELLLGEVTALLDTSISYSLADRPFRSTSTRLTVLGAAIQV